MSANPYLGEISIFGGNFAPRGWAFCKGQLLPISSYSALFSLLGTFYGGDGRTTFGLPDLTARVAVGYGQGNHGLSYYNIGQMGGEEKHTLQITEVPSHGHTASSNSKLFGQSAPGDDDTLGAGVSLASGSNTGSEVFSGDAPNTEMNASSVVTTTTVQNQGGGQSHNNIQPYTAINYIIALEGIYPSRS